MQLLSSVAVLCALVGAQAQDVSGWRMSDRFTGAQYLHSTLRESSALAAGPSKDPVRVNTRPVMSLYPLFCLAER